MHTPEETTSCIKKEHMGPMYFEILKERILNVLKKICGILSGVGAAIASTGTSVFSHLGGEMFHPMEVILCSSITMILLSILFVLMKWSVTKNANKYGISIAVCGLLSGCGSLSFSLGVILANPADAVAVYFFLPIIVIALETFIKCDKVKTLHILLSVCSVIGVGFVSKSSISFKGKTHLDILGIGFGMIGGILHACSFMIVQRLKQVQVHPLILCLAASCNMFVISLGIAAFLQCFRIPRTAEEIFVLLATGISQFMCNILIFLALAFERPYIVSILMTFEVAFTFIAQWAILNLTPTWQSAVGGCLISVACFGVALSKDEKNIKDDCEEENLVDE